MILVVAHLVVLLVMINVALVIVPNTISPKYIVLEYFEVEQKSITKYKRRQRKGTKSTGRVK